MWSGKKSFFVSFISAPIFSRNMDSLDIERLLNELSPTNVQLIGLDETAPIIKRDVVPLLPQSSTCEG